MEEDTGKGKQTATSHACSSEEREPTFKPPESSQATNLQHRHPDRQPATDNPPQRIITDHFLSFSTAADSDEEPTSPTLDIHPPTKPLPSHRVRCDPRLARDQQCHLCRIATEGNAFRD